MSKEGALSRVRVLDLTDETAIYGAKLLADLGADVVRPEPPEGDPLRQRGPFKEDTSLWHVFFASNRRFFCVEDVQSLHTLIANADVVLASANGFGVAELDFEALTEQFPSLVVIDISSFGSSGPWKDYLAPDLVAGALGGLVATTGTEDTPPLKSFGELNFMLAGAYAAIAALAGLYSRRQDGEGQTAELSVHESIASCLEHVFMFYWYHEQLAREQVRPRSGSTNWTNAYTVFPTRKGCIMVTPTPDFDRQLAWLIEEGVGFELLDPKYSEIEHAKERVQLTMTTLRDWVATKEAESLFHEAQSRHCPYGWVIPLSRLKDNEQLEARQWFTDVEINGETVRGPGAPYYFSETPWRSINYTRVTDVMADIGWEQES